MFNKRRKKFNKKQLELRQKREKYNIWFAFNAPINHVDFVYTNYKIHKEFFRPIYAIPNVEKFMHACEQRFEAEDWIWWKLRKELNY